MSKDAESNHRLPVVVGGHWNINLTGHLLEPGTPQVEGTITKMESANLLAAGISNSYDGLKFLTLQTCTVILDARRIR